MYNKIDYAVIHLDVQWCMMDAGSPDETVGYINANLIEEFRAEYPAIITDEVVTVYGAMSRVNAATGTRFVVIIDEWDVLIRDEVPAGVASVPLLQVF